MSDSQQVQIPQLSLNLDARQRAQRAFDLSIARTAYNYMFSYMEPLSLSADVPEGEGFTLDYEAGAAAVFLPLLENFKAVLIAKIAEELEGDLPMHAFPAIQQAMAALEELKQTSPMQLISEAKAIIKLIENLIEAFVTLPKELMGAVEGLLQLPKDLQRIVDGLGLVFKQAESEGFTAFLKNGMFDTLETSKGRDLLKARSFSDYRALYDRFPVPQTLDVEARDWMQFAPGEEAWQQDWYFGYMQTGGFNTTNLRAVLGDVTGHPGAISLDLLLKKLPITDEIFRQVVGANAPSLKAAAEKGLLYVCDYDMFEGIPGSLLHDLQRYVAAPIALFYWNDSPPAGYPPKGALQPVAIQLGQKPDPETTPLLTPNDCTGNNDGNGLKWALAKFWVQNACAMQHETVAHLGACHLVLEPIIVAAHRQLPADHPLLVLLKPHFRYTLKINDAALHGLIIPGGVVASLLSISIDGSKKVIAKAYDSWRFDEQNPDRLFRKRGVGPENLPDFPFRDDTLLLWRAIRRFVEAYLAVYYCGATGAERDSIVRSDEDLQNWINELVDPKYAAVKGLDQLKKTGNPDSPYQIAEFDYLVDVVSLMIYTASAQHASVNYAQYPLMTYIPSVSGSVYHAPPTASASISAEKFMDWLPPLDVALYQVSFGYLLSMIQYDTLGQYSRNSRLAYFKDSRIAPIVKQFQQDLLAAELMIRERNHRRPLPYLQQLPSMIPNSISI
jgi:arachidonate 15-lipoxygenase